MADYVDNPATSEIIAEHHANDSEQSGDKRRTWDDREDGLFKHGILEHKSLVGSALQTSFTALGFKRFRKRVKGASAQEISKQYF